jgi:hypothetical protein
MGTEPESVHAQEGTMQDVLARCLKKTEAQVCAKINRSMFAKKYSIFLSRICLLENQHSKYALLEM